MALKAPGLEKVVTWTPDFVEVDDIGFEAISLHKDLMEDKCGVTTEPRNICFKPTLIGVTKVEPMKIRNSSSQTYTLKKILFNYDGSVCPFQLKPSLKDTATASTSNPPGEYTLGPGSELEFDVYCTPKLIGRTVIMGVFDFGSFQISRRFCVVGRSEEEETVLGKKGIPDKDKPRPKSQKQLGELNLSKMIEEKGKNLKRVRGSLAIRPPFFSQKKLPFNGVPKELFKIMRDQDEGKLQKKFPNALDDLSFESYKQKFQVGLWFEEIENDIRRRQYDLHGVTMEKCGSNPVQFKFNAPGIQDFNPPVNIQDTIDVFDPACDSNVKYQGTIMKIFESTVTCIFGEKFNEQYKGSPLTIQFNLGRTNYKRCHFAVQTAVDFLGKNFLFPEPDIPVQAPRILVYEEDGVKKADKVKCKVANGKAEPGHSKAMNGASSSAIFRKQKPAFSSNLMGPPSSSNILIGRRAPSVRGHFVSDTQSAPSCSTARLEWFNRSLNEEQKNAVRCILRGEARPIPYIIYGPPGTGKTVTLVEAVMQVNKLDQNSRILVCAPSNSAADVIAEYLVNSNQYQPGDFVRLNGFFRSGQTMLEAIEPFCVDGEDLINVAKHRLIIATCTTAGQFFSLDLSVGHFTHVFVDEAGYCTEPETMVPTTLLALSKGGQLILVGDPNQLGPVVISEVSENLGLKKSFLERLMARQLYCRDEERFPKEKYNPVVLTKLTKNYRSHPVLLKLPSSLFYDDDLVPGASYEEAFALCEDEQMKDVLVSQGVPLIFHGVQGQCSRDGDSPSWWNKQEAIVVASYVTTLLKICGLTCDDIGIITPYRKQVEKIRLALQLNLRTSDDSIPKVASVEEFQGGERKIIIISTVRSANEDRIDKQLERLGFLYQPKRFNVAITRAKALLIAIGNPFVLSKNNFWLQLLRYALDLNAYTGCNLPIHLDKNMRSLTQINHLSESESESDEEDEDESEDSLSDESALVDFL